MRGWYGHAVGMDGKVWQSDCRKDCMVGLVRMMKMFVCMIGQFGSIYEE